MRTRSSSVIAAGTLFAHLAAAAAAEAQTLPGGCTRTFETVPLLATQPGRYCLTRDASIAAEGTAVQVLSDSVTIDLGGFTISNTDPTGTQLISGVVAFSFREVTVRNGTLRGFLGGVVLDDSDQPGRARNNVVEDVRVLDSVRFGIVVEGAEGRVQRSTVSGVRALSAAIPDASGIAMSGTSVQALDNSVSIGAPSSGGTGYGIRVSGGWAAVLGNRVAGNGTRTIGVSLAGARAAARDNVVWRTPTPYAGVVNLGNNSSF
jgi:hypothetical protein